MDDSFNWRFPQDPISRDISTGKATQAVPTASGKEKARQANLEYQRATPVQLPFHLFVPPGAQTLDMRVAADIAANTTSPTLLMSFKCPKGAVTHFLSYAIFSDGSLAANQEFIPRVDGKRVFPYHGDPNNNFKINLGLAPDLSNNSLIQCQLTLNPDETVQWLVRNLNIVSIAMGVRMFGYVDRSQKRINARAGG